MLKVIKIDLKANYSNCKSSESTEKKMLSNSCLLQESSHPVYFLKQKEYTENYLSF